MILLDILSISSSLDSVLLCMCLYSHLSVNLFIYAFSRVQMRSQRNTAI